MIHYLINLEPVYLIAFLYILDLKFNW